MELSWYKWKKGENRQKSQYYIIETIHMITKYKTIVDWFVNYITNLNFFVIGHILKHMCVSYGLGG